MKILLLDDEPFVLQLLARQLENLGFTEVTLVERADEALSVIAASGVELIFCDLNMPEMDGVEFVRHLVRLGYGGGLILVSGVHERILNTARKLAEAHRLNVLGALHKPVALEQLRRILENYAPTTNTSRAPCRSYCPEELQQAIAGGELVNFYQPKVTVASGDVAGVETLVRWRHADAGLVFPDQFIGVAEEHGLIDDLTHAVLIAALRQARAWRNAGLSLSLAVNVSMDNLSALDFPDVLARLAGEAGIPLTSLVLEVTESRLMKNPLAALDILTRLRLKGVGLSIDDFGTGHSSLVQLRDIPFDELKVDRGFVHGAGQDESLGAIFMANLAMARQLGLRTVAEGVEDRADWDYLRQAGCDYAQGYLIARPMPAEDFADWFSDWDTRRRDLGGSQL